MSLLNFQTVLDELKRLATLRAKLVNKVFSIKAAKHNTNFSILLTFDIHPESTDSVDTEPKMFRMQCHTSACKAWEKPPGGHLLDISAHGNR